MLREADARDCQRSTERRHVWLQSSSCKCHRWDGKRFGQTCHGYWAANGKVSVIYDNLSHRVSYGFLILILTHQGCACVKPILKQVIRNLSPLQESLHLIACGWSTQTCWCPKQAPKKHSEHIRIFVWTDSLVADGPRALQKDLHAPIGGGSAGALASPCGSNSAESLPWTSIDVKGRKENDEALPLSGAPFAQIERVARVLIYLLVLRSSSRELARFSSWWLCWPRCTCLRGQTANPEPLTRLVSRFTSTLHSGLYGEDWKSYSWPRSCFRENVTRSTMICLHATPRSFETIGVSLKGKTSSRSHSAGGKSAAGRILKERIMWFYDALFM